MKMLKFYDAANKMYILPADKFESARYGDAATEVEMFFKGATSGAAHTKVSLTIDNGTIDNVLKSIGAVIQSHRGPIVTIADDVNGVYLMDSITAITGVEVGDYAAA